MMDLFHFSADMTQTMHSLMTGFSRSFAQWTEASLESMKATQNYWTGLSQYADAFADPSWNAMEAFTSAEEVKLQDNSARDNVRDYAKLAQLNMDIAGKKLTAGLLATQRFCFEKANENIASWFDFLAQGNPASIQRLATRRAQATRLLIDDYPRAIRDIRAEYGFHFDQGGYVKVGETDRFELYQVLPLDKTVQIRETGKPVLILPPYVLGANILAFLPGENRSYVHCFAGQGIPTYVRIVKPIDENPAVQLMTGEDDARDTRHFCSLLQKKHGHAVTLNGFCQGGFVAVVNLLCGELDGLVDALITNVAPLDGTRSVSLKNYMNSLSLRFQDMRYALKTLPNGNQVVDGKIMGWVYKLRSMESEAPVAAYHRDLALFERQSGATLKISKTAAAINHWMIYDRTDLPVAVTQMSFQSYTTPVAEDGTLPMTLFGRRLNFKRIQEMGIPWLICIAEKDDLVDAPSALAPLDYIDAEVSVYPKGHAAMATSWSLPTSECAHHQMFGTCVPGTDATTTFRGPVRFHLDLEEAMNEKVQKKS